MKRTLIIRVEVDVKKDDLYAALEKGASKAVLDASQAFTKYKRHNGYGGIFGEKGAQPPEVPGHISYEWSVES